MCLQDYKLYVGLGLTNSYHVTNSYNFVTNSSKRLFSKRLFSGALFSIVLDGAQESSIVSFWGKEFSVMFFR